MLIIRRLNCIDAAFGTVLSVSGRPVHTVHRTATERTIPDAASVQFSLLMMSIQCSKHVEECNKCIVKYSKCASRWSLSKIILRCTVNKT